MDDFDDFDSLLDFEADLLEEEGSKKRTAADLASQRDAAASLGIDAATAKRLRADPVTGTPPGFDDETLLALADEVAGPPSAPGLASQPGATAAGKPSRLGGALPATVPQDLDDNELDQLLAMETDEAAAPASPARRPAATTAAGASAAAGAGKEVPVDAEEEPAAPARQGLDAMLPLRPYEPPRRDVIHIEGDFLTVTSASGERVYAPVTPAQGAFGSASRVDIAGALRRARGTLLSRPVAELMAEVENDQFERALAETKAAKKKAEREAAAASPGAATTPRPTKKQRRASDAAATPALWVDKYAPKSFLDLLSDEQVNRDVVRWLKSWDTCVFGGGEGDGGAAAAKKAAKARAAGRKGVPHSDENADPLGRPAHKVILLAGPPGLGKTTLAHVVARHCGYRPVEINASDDRSGTTLTARVLDAVQMKSVMGERRANCLVIDEIDGAAGGAEGRGAIAALIKIITATPGKKTGGSGAEAEAKAPSGDASDSEDDDGGGGEAVRGGGVAVRRRGGGGGVAKQKLRPLMRPIICICNDLYAPVLRPLRDIAKVFHLRKPSAESLAVRLAAIAAAEGLRAEKSTLRLLAERSECDVRSCLNTLQFLAKRQAVVRQADLTSLGVGQKDVTKGAFQVWGELLQRKKAPSVIGRVAENDAQRCARLYNMLLDFGEAELVLAGVHEALPALRYFDIGLGRTEAVLASLEDADTLMRACGRSGDFSLMKYLPAPTLAVAAAVAGPERPQLAWPRAAAEARRRTAGNRATLQQWLLGMAPGTYTALGADAAITDLVPLLPALTTPALRPVSRHLFSKEERACVDRLVSTLLSLGLRFSLFVEEMDGDDAGGERSALFGAGGAGGIGGHGQSGGRAGAAPAGPQDPPLQFRPAVHRLWHFRGAVAPEAPRRSLTIATRQMVGHEVDMEAIRRADATRQAAAAAFAAANPTPAKEQPTADEAGVPSTQKKTGHVPLDLAQRLRESGVAGRHAKVAAAAAAPRKGNWLDQLREKQTTAAIAAAAAALGGNAGVTGPARFPVLYKFHEGYTNAVKRPVLMKELL